VITALRRHALTVLGLVVLARGASATDLHVPSQYVTIQAAISAAAPGDRVLVDPGTYHEAIDFAAKGIEVIGVGGAAVTTITAAGLGASVVTLKHAEPASTMLQGFTITGGDGQLSGNRGGGVFIGGAASPTVRECIITGNSVSDRGGGIFVGPGPSPSSGPTIVDCVISGNQASGYGGGVYGSGIASTGWPVIRDCKIAGNQAGYGGGCAGSGDFIDCAIESNIATGYGGGGYAVHSLRDSVLRGNSAALFGGGYYDYQVYYVQLKDCVLLENSAQIGGGAYLSSDSPSLLGGPGAFVGGCVFARNTASVGTDGLSLSFTYFVPPQSTVTNCSFDANRLSGAGTIEIKNCIIRGVSFASAVGASYSDIEGVAVGPGNIDADPLWIDPAAGDYRLQGCSPCIDAGDPASPLDADGTVVEMGALRFESWTNLDGGVPGSSGDAILAGSGLLTAGSSASLALTNSSPATQVWLILSARALAQPFKGGTLWPTLDVVVTGLSTDATGSLQLAATWPPLIGCGFTLYAQAWWLDPGAESGWAGSNGLRAVSR
jgi:hypothetical protein